MKPRTEPERPIPICPSLEEQAYIALQRSADRLETVFAQWLRPHGLSPTQYNALRILRGAGEHGLPCSDIGERMITRDPDITRLVDRLKKRGFVVRSQDEKDRRVIRATITPAGLQALRALDVPLQKFIRDLLGHLGQEKLGHLVDLLEAATSDERPASESCP